MFKRDTTWLGLGSAILFILRFPSFFDPLWYGDETYYMAIGQALRHGQTLYSQVWDNKPPFLYLIYALSNGIFGNELWPLRVFNFTCGLLTLFFIYKIGKSIFKFKLSVYSTLIILSSLFFGVFFESTIFNAENLFVPLVLGGFYFFYTAVISIFSQINFSEKEQLVLVDFFKQNKSNITLLAIGSILWGLALFTKIPTAPEIVTLIATTLLVALNNHRQKYEYSFIKSIRMLSQNKIVISTLILSFGIIILPFVLTMIFYYFQGSLSEFYFALFGYNVGYVHTDNIPSIFGLPLPVSGLVFRTIILMIWLLLVTLLYIITNRNISTKITDTPNLKSHMPAEVYVFCTWAAAVIYSIFLSERSYPHYLLQFLPLFIFGIGYIIQMFSSKSVDLLKASTQSLLILLLVQFTLQSFTMGSGLYSYFGLNQYWGGFSTVITRKTSLKDWQTSYDPFIINRQRLLTPLVQQITKPDDKIYIVGNMPEIYVASERVNAYKLVVDYHTLPNEDNTYVYSYLRKEKAQLILIDNKSPKAKDFIKLSGQDYKLIQKVPYQNTFFLFYIPKNVNVKQLKLTAQDSTK